MHEAPLPPLPYDDWEDTKTTVQLVTQIMGKIRMAWHPKLNHWWHLTLRITPRGVSTGPIPVPGGSFEIEFDVHTLYLFGKNSAGKAKQVSLDGRCIADVYRDLMAMTASLHAETHIVANPFEVPNCTIPFAEDREHKSWDHDAILRWWRALSFIDEAFTAFAGRSYLKTSPVQLFWHSFDIAVTRFTGRRAPSYGEGPRRSDIEAYTHEVISFGWWPGDPNVRFPAFYSYTSPEPPGVEKHPLGPATAWWQELPSSHMAMLKWEDVRTSDNPREAVMAFLESAYQAGAKAITATGARVDFEAQETGSLWDELDRRFPGSGDHERW